MVEASQIDTMTLIVASFQEWQAQQANVTKMAAMPLQNIKQVVATYHNGNTTISIAFEGSDDVFGLTFKGGSVIPQAVTFAVQQIQSNLDAKKAEIDALFESLTQ